MKKTILTLLSFCVFGLLTNAQSWDDSGDTWDNSGDSWDNGGGGKAKTAYDYDPSGSGAPALDSAADDGWGSDDSWGGDGGFNYGNGGQDYVRSSRPDIEAKPYERFTGMPYDSTDQLVTFVEIVEVIVPDRFLDLGGEDYSSADSLYARAIVWMKKQFGEKEAKRMIDKAGLDPDGKEGQTIKAYVIMPLTVEVNPYQKTTVGVIEFEMELRFKDERYRYKFNNFVHVTPDRSGGKEDDATYMEYYLTAKKNIRGNDKILMACNNQITRLIDDLKATCAATPFIDDDDW